MSIDSLKNKIRKLRNPSAVTIAPTMEQVPPMFLTAFEDPVMAMGEYCVKVLEALKGLLPTARVNFGSFAIHGAEGLNQLERVLDAAAKLGYYVILDWQRLEDPAGAKAAAELILVREKWKCDAVVLCGYAGSDCVRPYIAAAGKKDVYVTLKTPNKSGSELQDLQTGGRVVYTAGADLLTRWGGESMDRCGYSRVAAVVSATHGASIRTIREKYPRLFLLVDGLEASGANAKNASLAFDKLGYGALVCSNLLGAWQEAGDADPVTAAQEAAERMKRNVTRYVTVL